MLKRILSYIVPINIHKTPSTVSKRLEVTWTNGQLVLDSAHTNYSFGSLQRILRKGLLKIGFENVRQMNHILVLGVAGGSVIRTLIDEIKYTGRITGVEIDKEVVSIANSYFGLDRIPNLEIIIDDAFEFILKTKEKYDLIIIDIFMDTEMPNFLFEKFFVDRIHFLLNNGGFFIFNTMTLTKAHNDRNHRYLSEVEREKFTVAVMPRVENHNELIVAKKVC